MSLIPTFYPQYISLPIPPHISSPHPFVLLLVLVLVVQVFSWLGPREPKSVCWDHFLHQQEEIQGWPPGFRGFQKISIPFCRLEHQGKNKHDTFLLRFACSNISPHLSRKCRRHFSQGLIHCGYLRMIKLPQGGSTSPSRLPLVEPAGAPGLFGLA